MIKEALQYITGLKEAAMAPQKVEIGDKVYYDKDLSRYGREDLAERIKTSTLSSLVDYIIGKSEELRANMILHVVDPKTVTLYSGLLKEQRRETLMQADAIVNEFQFDKYYDQERFLIELQANFLMNEDLAIIMKVAGNIQAGTTANYSDDGVSQKTTIKQGVTRSDVLVPNPVKLIPYRTFSQVEQPASNYVFRISEDNGQPTFKLVEADNGLWKNVAMENIKEYLHEELGGILDEKHITIIA